MITVRRFARPNLTPLIDVVFLLLLFFMLSTQLTSTKVIDATVASGGANNSETPYLIELGADITLDGTVMPLDAVISAIQGAPRAIAIRADEAATTGDLVAMIDVLRTAGDLPITWVEAK